MRLATSLLSGLAFVLTSAIAAPASAATIVIYADPMTLERRTVIVESEGPDRAFLCMMPPSIAGCQPVPLRRSRR